MLQALQIPEESGPNPVVPHRRESLVFRSGEERSRQGQGILQVDHGEHKVSKSMDYDHIDLLYSRSRHTVCFD